ncbi:MAG: MBL fold metallo-hydrolase [Chloroflexi bacterium]|nr:MBL fold metallo-hydrolase [Chloroflexota bacterium]
MERARVGSVELVSLLDINFNFPVDRVYPQAGPAIDRYRQHLNADGQVPMGCLCFLLRADGRTVLVDTGMGPESSGQLIAELRAAGVAPDAVDVVVYTHLHGDHTGWSIDRGSGKPLFSKARYLVPQGDWDHYRAQAQARSFERDIAPLEAAGCMEVVGGDHVIGPSVRTVATPGHTPGHLSVAVESGGERGFILGDVVLSAIDTAEPEWQNTFDGDHEVARRTRLATLDRLERDGALVGAAHMLPPGLGRFVRVDGRRTWRAGA